MLPTMGAIIFEKNIHTMSKEVISVAGKGVGEVENTVGREENKSSHCWKTSISKTENVREVENFDSFRRDNILFLETSQGMNAN